MARPKEEIVKRAYDLGFNYEKEYVGCCQCTIAAIQDTLGMENDAVFKAGTGLAGGIGATGFGPCGALTGGVMVISSKIGRDRSNFKDPERIRWKSYEIAKKLYDKFVEEYGSGACSDIQQKLMGRSFNLWEPADFEEFEKAGGHTEKCPSVVANAAKWAVELLIEV